MPSRPSVEVPVSIPPLGMGVVGGWRLLKSRSWGAYGTVFRAERLDRPGEGTFALKLAHHPRDPRFVREAELLRRVRHPHVPCLHDAGQWEHPSGPFPYLVMDWVEGEPLYAWARGRQLSSRQVMGVLAGVAKALAATHAAEAVHRDVKGDNILVRPEDMHPTLLDFGAGDFRGAPIITSEVLPPGTPGYRSPEALSYQERYWRTQGAHYKPGPADDLYALGVTAYRLVTGFYPPPWVPAEVRERDPSFPTVDSEPPEKWVTVSPELAGIIRQLLAEEPTARGSAAQVAEALEEAVRSAGAEADEPILQRASMPPASRRSQSGPSRPVGARWPWASAAGLMSAVGLASAVLITQVDQEIPLPPQSLEELPPPVRDEGREDAGTSLATEALMASTQEEQPPDLTWDGLEGEMPDKPLPGQAKPPCKQRSAVVINGGCWVRPEVSTPPCKEGEYEWERLCYLPILSVTRRPSTSEPR
ncbi:serine/threonine protein kinase [Hyalangium versicolor]|uniref:serine/threonine protein kinase n=1 Tax=Hyalangium versicolor TaxID=2861190 RepID=UPI001CCEAFCC|nr:serine/threonine-protein kinase [Hyalangium versicolor]